MPTVNWLPSTTGRFSAAPTARMPTSGILRMASNWRVPNIPRFEIVNVPPVSCSPVSVPDRAAAARASLWSRISIEPQGIGIMQDRDDQAVVEGDGDPDIDLAVADDRIGLEAGIHARMKPQGQGDGLGHEVAERDLDSIAGKSLVELFAGGHEPVDAGIDGQMDLGSGLLGLKHALGDRLAHPRVRDALRRPERCDDGAGDGLLRRAGLRPAWSQPPPRLACLGLSLKKCLDVAADDPAAGARPAHLAELDLRRRRHLARQRTGLEPARRRVLPRRRRLLAVARGMARRGAPRRPAVALAAALHSPRPQPRSCPSPSDSTTFLGSSPFLASTITR